MMADNKKSNEVRITDHAVAPYNFVSLPYKSKAAYQSFDELPSPNRNEDSSLLSGYIDYTIKNHTPIIIGQGKNENRKNGEIEVVEPFKSDNKYVIPGNTIRGVIRSNVGILSCSNMIEDIEDNRFSFRSFGNDSLSREFKERLDIKSKVLNGDRVSAPFNINGGYIYKKDKDTYVIEPVKKENDYSYYRISEQYLRKINPIDTDIKYMYNKDSEKLITEKHRFTLKKEDKNNKQLEREINNRKKAFLRSIKNSDYRPYYTEISYNIKNTKTITHVGKKDKYSKNGYILSSECIDGKLAHYIIPSDRYDKDSEIVINKEKIKFIESYNNDLLRTKKYELKDGVMVPKNDSYKYFSLPEEEGENNGKPIFFGKFRDNIYLGFSPYLRVVYDYSVHDGINKNHKNSDGISYMDALFGFTNKETYRGSNSFKDYKSRLSFEDCICNDENIELQKFDPIILSEPHPTAYKLYLKQPDNPNSKEIVTYNYDDFKINGIKQYWIRENISIPKKEIENIKSNDVKIILNAIPKDNIFEGKIHFKNISRKELGLLLWAIKVDEYARENIGLGKPYGFGHVEIKDINVYLESLEKKYYSITNDYYEKQSKEDIEGLIGSFKEKVEINQSIRDFINLKTTIIKDVNKDEFRYMNFNEFRQAVCLLTPEKQIKIIRADFKNTDIKTKGEKLISGKKQFKKKRSYGDQLSKSKKDTFQDSFMNNEGFAALRNFKFEGEE